MRTKSKLIIILKREYFRIIKSKSFWLSTLMLPLLMLVIGGVSYISQSQLEEKLVNASKDAKMILIVDQAGIINSTLPFFVQPNVRLSDNIDYAIDQVKTDNASAVLVYPENILTTFKIGIYAPDEGIFSQGKFNDFATNLLKQSIIADIKDPDKIILFNAPLSIDQHLFKDGKESTTSLATMIVPFVSVIVYFLFTSFATNYLLMSVSEEKENRMIEIILASVTPKQLIWGKILGQVGVIITQMLILIGFGLIALKVSSFSLPFNFGDIQINPWQVVMAIIYILCGFLILANTMVGSGAAMPNYKDAQSFSTIFILLSVFPIYLYAFILSDPNGLLAYFTSYFPYSAPIILLLRNALGAVGPFEVVVSFLVLVLYIYITGVIAYKLFEYGALEYNQKISFSNFFKSIKLKK